METISEFKSDNIMGFIATSFYPLLLYGYCPIKGNSLTKKRKTLIVFVWKAQVQTSLSNGQRQP